MPVQPQPKNEHALRKLVSEMFAAWALQCDGFWYLKVSGSRFQRPGVLDYLLQMDGHALAIELKHPTDPDATLTALQEKERTRLLRAGASVAVARSLEDVLRACQAAYPHRTFARKLLY